MYHYCFIYSSVDGHLGCFHVLAIVSSAAMNSEIHGKSNMEIYITICKINSQWEFSVWLRKLQQGLCINLEGWMGREMGGRFKTEGIYVYL